MAQIHKLTKDGQVIYPATTTKAVVDPDLRVPLSKMVEEINVSKLFPTGGVSGSNKYTLETAIAKIPAAYRTVGIKCLFVAEDGSVQTYVYQGGTFTSADSWEYQINRKDIIKAQDYDVKKGIAGNINFSFKIGKTLNSACVIVETILLDKDFKPASYISLGTILERRLAIDTDGDVVSNLNTHVSHKSNTKTGKVSIIVANRNKIYNINTAIIWSDYTKKYVSERQFVLLSNNLSILINGHEKVAIGDIIILGRELEPSEIPIAHKNPRSFLNDAVAFFPKEKYTENYAIEVCSNSIVKFKNKGIIL